MARILLLSNVDRSFPGYPEARAALEGAGHVVVDPGGRFVADHEAISLVHDVDGIVVGGVHQLRAPVLRAGHRLRVVVREGIGVDNIDVDEATRLGIVVANTAGSNADSVADHVFAMLLALVRDLFRLGEDLRRGAGWSFRPPLGQLGGRTMGVIGTGNVGRGVVRRAVGFGMPVLANDLVPDPTLSSLPGVRYVSVDELLAGAEILTMHVPLTPVTDGMIGPAELARLPPGSIVVNTARGRIVDLAAVAEVLRSGHLAGAAIDVWPGEPIVDHELFALPNVIATPHVGGNSTQSSRNARTWGARNLMAALGGAPRDVVNPEVLVTPQLRLAGVSVPTAAEG